MSAPGLYEIRFEDLEASRYLAPEPRRVAVREGETPDVIVDLRRR